MLSLVVLVTDEEGLNAPFPVRFLSSEAWGEGAEALAEALIDSLGRMAHRVGDEAHRVHDVADGLLDVADGLLVIVVGEDTPTNDVDTLEAVASDHIAAGGTAVAVLSPDAVAEDTLPRSLRDHVAIRMDDDLRDAASELVDLIYLNGEPLRAFVSYAHADGREHAYRVFEALAKHRFDVYLDQFRTEPSANFVERIEDELRSKAMVVVVESTEAAASTWVMYEVATALNRRLGLIGLNIGGATPHPLISGSRRVELPEFDEATVVRAVRRHYRAAVVDQRKRRGRAVELALLGAGADPSSLTRIVDRCDLHHPDPGYVVLGAFRSPGTRVFRYAAAEAPGPRPIVCGPRPIGSARRADLDWLAAETPVTFVPDGRLLDAARAMVNGRL